MELDLDILPEVAQDSDAAEARARKDISLILRRLSRDIKGRLISDDRWPRMLARRGNRWQSPIARYVRRHCDDTYEGNEGPVERVRMGHDCCTLFWEVDGVLLFTELPGEVAAFEAQFQAGLHKWLEG